METNSLTAGFWYKDAKKEVHDFSVWKENKGDIVDHKKRSKLVGLSWMRIPNLLESRIKEKSDKLKSP